MSARPRSSRRPGSFAAVTISTNMAGRGTDIVLGGNPEVWRRRKRERATPMIRIFRQALARYREHCALNASRCWRPADLHILGTERHESRRIDNQLRGRSGRQGDPGSSRFYLSLEDDLLRIFGADRLKGLMGRIGNGRRRSDRASMDFARDRERAEKSRGPQLRHSQTSARIRRRDEPAARGGLPSPPRTASPASRSRRISSRCARSWSKKLSTRTADNDKDPRDWDWNRNRGRLSSSNSSSARTSARTADAKERRSNVRTI